MTIDLPDLPDLPGSGLPGTDRPGQPAVDPLDLPGLPDINPVVLRIMSEFSELDPDTPLALFPIRLEARFLPDDDPTEVVVRVFPDQILVDAHDPDLSPTEEKLAQDYWQTVSEAEGDEAAISLARSWLAGQLEPHRGAYVAAVTAPTSKIPTSKNPPSKKASPARVKLAEVGQRSQRRGGVARLLPTRWVAYVDLSGGEEWSTRGPYLATNDVVPDLAVTPTLVDLPSGADARDFLDAQGLGWTHDLVAAEAAGMVIRIPLQGLDTEGGVLDRLYVFGIRPGADADADVRALLDAHRATDGLEILPPGTVTNVTDLDGPEPLDLDALFDAELEAELAGRPGGPPKGGRAKPQPPAFDLIDGEPAPLLDAAFGLGPTSALDRTRAANDRFPQLATAASRVLWSATWGKWLSSPMRWADTGGNLLGSDIGVMRSWYMEWLRAEGPLPTIQVGAQPYGILPTGIFDTAPESGWSSTIDETLFRLFDYWTESRNSSDAPTLDPDASDTRPIDEVAEQASEVGEVLGAVPNVGQLRLRPADDTHTDLGNAYGAYLWFLELLLSVVPDAGGNFYDPDDLPATTWFGAYLDAKADIDGASGARGQRAALDDLRVYIDGLGGTQSQRDALQVAADYIWDTILPIVDRHLGRVRPYEGVVTWELLEDLGMESALGSDRAPRLAAAGYGEEGSELAVEVLVGAQTAEVAADLAAWLRSLADALHSFATGGPVLEVEFDGPVSLFEQLVATTARIVAKPSADLAADGLETFADLLDDEGPDAIPTIERLVRASLGPAMYRLDAWITASVAERLAQQRAKRPTGLQVGCFGWLVDLEAREGRASQGFIHAPSLEHATTAAVLRSGWSAFGTGEAGSPLAVDLSSGRIKAAVSLIEGVRTGQELGRLIGQRFERRLHDQGLDRWIDDVRAAVLRGAGQGRRPPTRVVDGLLVTRSQTDGIVLTPSEEAVRDELAPILAAEPALDEVIADSVADLDAVADVLMAQSVHHLLRGNDGVASASLAATGSGDAGLPPIDFPQTRRSGTTIAVRVAGFLAEVGPAPGWELPVGETSLLALAEPRLEHWVGEVLGPADRIVVVVESDDGLVPIGLDQLGLGALDVVYHTDTIQARAAALVGPGDPVAPGADRITFDDLVVLADQLRQALAQLRPLRAGDFGLDATGPDEAVLGQLEQRLTDLQAALAADDPRHDELAQHLVDHPGRTVELLQTRIQLLAGVPLPILPTLAAAVPSELQTSFEARHDRSDHDVAHLAWLAQAARVRPHLQAVVGAVQIAEMLRDRPITEPVIAQSPDPGGPWVGLAVPATAEQHTAWCSLTGPPPSGGELAGFVADSWTEVVPDPSTTTGIAIHYDRPSAHAPNAVLLAVSRPGEDFSMLNVMRTLRGTLSLAQLRAVGPDDPLFESGQFLPAVFLDDDVELASEQPIRSAIGASRQGARP